MSMVQQLHHRKPDDTTSLAATVDTNTTEDILLPPPPPSNADHAQLLAPLNFYRPTAPTFDLLSDAADAYYFACDDVADTHPSCYEAQRKFAQQQQCVGGTAAQAQSDSRALPECKVKRNYSCTSCKFFTQNPRSFLYHLRDTHGERVKVYECPHCLYASRHYQKLLRHTRMVHGGAATQQHASSTAQSSSSAVTSGKTTRRKRYNSATTAAPPPPAAPPVISNISSTDASTTAITTSATTHDVVNNNSSSSNDDASGAAVTSEEDATLPDADHDEAGGEDDDHQVTIEAVQQATAVGGVAATKWKCSMCQFVAKSQQQLTRHETEKHIKTKFFRCTKCSYVTHMKARYTKHVKYHSMPMIKCELCDFKTPYKWNLDRHCKNHNGNGTFRCSVCNFTADIKQSLTVHEMNHHVPPVGQAAAAAAAAAASNSSASNAAGAGGFGAHAQSGGRRKNKVGASDCIASADEYSEAIDKKPVSTRTTTSAYGAGDFVNSDDVVAQRNGVVHLKTQCKYCHYKTAWPAEMTRHEEREHGVADVQSSPPPAPPPAPLVVKKTPRPVPNLIPLPTTTAKSPDCKDIRDLYANSGLKDMAPLFESEQVFKEHHHDEQQKRRSTNSNNKFELKNAPFFLKLKEKLLNTESSVNMVCQFCGHESKYLTECVSHQKICAKDNSDRLSDAATPPPPPISLLAAGHSSSSSRCQFCRQRCKSSADLLTHIQTCAYMVSASHVVKDELPDYTDDRHDADDEIDDDDDSDSEHMEIEMRPEDLLSVVEEPAPTNHPMVNRVFVWNDIEAPVPDVDDAHDRYEYIEDSRTTTTEDNADAMSLDLSVRTQSPPPPQLDCEQAIPSATVSKGAKSSSVHSFKYHHPPAVEHNQPTPTAASATPQSHLVVASFGKIPTHGNDITVAQHKRVFKCPHCSFWASTASRFHVHIVGHLNKKPFECSLCSYRSNWRWDITKHIKLKSVRDPNHETAKVLMTDETGRRNYTKYNKYLTEIRVNDADGNSGGAGTRVKQNSGNVTQQPGGDEDSMMIVLPSTLPGASSTGNRGKRQPPPPPDYLQTHSELMAQMITTTTSPSAAGGGSEHQQQDRAGGKKRGASVAAGSATDAKKPMYKCKKCNVKDSSHERMLEHVKAAHASSIDLSLLSSNHIPPFHETDYKLFQNHIATSNSPSSRQRTPTPGSTHSSTGNHHHTSATTTPPPSHALPESSIPTTILETFAKFFQQPDALKDPTALSAIMAKYQEQLSNDKHQQQRRERDRVSSPSPLPPTGVVDDSVLVTTGGGSGGCAGGAIDADAAVAATMSLSPSPPPQRSSSAGGGAAGVAALTQAPFSCGHCYQVSNWKHVIQRHCRLKHSGDISVIVGGRGGQPDRIEVDRQLAVPTLSDISIGDQTSTRAHHQLQQQRFDDTFAGDAMQAPPVPMPQNGEFRCSMCPYSTDLLPDYQRHSAGHLDDDSDRENDLRCPQCGFRVEQIPEMLAHLALHGFQDPVDYWKRWNEMDISKRYKCSACPFVTNNKSQYQQHKQYHVDTNGQYKCTKCTFNVNKRNLLRTHHRVHDMKTEVPDVDDAGSESDCGGANIERQKTLSQQQQQQFPDIPLVWVSLAGQFLKMYKCRQCPHLNERKPNIREHEKMHACNLGARGRLQQGQHQCSQCDYVSMNAGVLSSHLKYHQGCHGVIHCLVDPDKSDAEQIQHLSALTSLPTPGVSWPARVITNDGDDTGVPVSRLPAVDSTDEMPKHLMFCHECPARFVIQNEYDIHRDMHASGLPFKCKYCSYTAKVQETLTLHFKVHTTDYRKRTMNLMQILQTRPGHEAPRLEYLSSADDVLVVADDLNDSNNNVHDDDDDIQDNDDDLGTTSKILAESLRSGSRLFNTSNTTSSGSIPLSGTDLFQHRHAEESRLRREESGSVASVRPKLSPTSETDDVPADLSIDTTSAAALLMMGTGNPAFVYPTYVKNGRAKEKRYKCEKCPTAFEKKEQYLSHLNLHGSKQRYECQQCDYSVSHQSNFVQHVRKHEISDEAQKSSFSSSSLSHQPSPSSSPDHQSPRNTSSPVYRCTNCPYFNRRQDALDNHQKRHYSISGQKQTHGCEHCDYSVAQAHILRDHLKLHFQSPVVPTAADGSPAKIQGYLSASAAPLRLTVKATDKNDSPARMLFDENDESDAEDSDDVQSQDDGKLVINGDIKNAA